MGHHLFSRIWHEIVLLCQFFVSEGRINWEDETPLSALWPQVCLQSPLLEDCFFAWQVGQGSTEDELRPCLVSTIGGQKIVGIAAGLWHTLCITDIGGIYAFGGNQFGQLGVGGNTAEVRFLFPKISSSVLPYEFHIWLVKSYDFMNSRLDVLTTYSILISPFNLLSCSWSLAHDNNGKKGMR